MEIAFWEVSSFVFGQITNGINYTEVFEYFFLLVGTFFHRLLKIRISELWIGFLLISTVILLDSCVLLNFLFWYHCLAMMWWIIMWSNETHCVNYPFRWIIPFGEILQNFDQVDCGNSLLLMWMFTGRSRFFSLAIHYGNFLLNWSAWTEALNRSSEISVFREHHLIGENTHRQWYTPLFMWHFDASIGDMLFLV